SMGQPPYSDTMGYYLAQKYVIDHNEAESPIAIVKDGAVVGSFAMHNMGAFDTIQRQVFFEIASLHPWLVAKAFVFDKPLAELTLITEKGDAFRPRAMLWAILLALACGAFIAI